MELTYADTLILLHCSDAEIKRLEELIEFSKETNQRASIQMLEEQIERITNTKLKLEK